MAYNDETPMPFGMHHKKRLGEIPGSYLLWLYDQIIVKHITKRSLSEKEMIAYIEDNMEILKKEQANGN